MNVASPEALPPAAAAPHPRRRWLLWTLVVLALLAAAAVAGRQLATNRLKATIETTLGPNSEVASIEAGFSSIAINGMRIRGGKDWPAAEELSAKRVIVKPDWGALLARSVRIASIEVEDGYISMLRNKDGKLTLLPSLLSRQESTAAPAGALPEIVIGGVVLTNAAVDFYDASVRQPAHRLRLEQTSVRLGTILLPALTGHTDIELDGTIKGVRHDGQVSIRGWAEIATRESEIQSALAGVDLVTFQPYLIKATETGVRKGSLDLGLKSTVKKNRLYAPGHLTLSGLELTTNSTFMGMPREAVVGALKDKNGRIAADFVLEGDINDPKFALNEKFMTQIAASTANVLGISLEGLARGIGSAGAGAVSGIGSAVGKLLGGNKK